MSRLSKREKGPKSRNLTLSTSSTTVARRRKKKQRRKNSSLRVHVCLLLLYVGVVMKRMASAAVLEEVGLSMFMC